MQLRKRIASVNASAASQPLLGDSIMFSHSQLSTLVLSAGLFSLPAASVASTFGYSGETSPAYWGELDPAWSACKSGKIQSPVNLKGPVSHGHKHGRKLLLD
jgi:carbonic anhydrase